jgi:CubicO group peptidase (beta-lactamase class C family)
MGEYTNVNDAIDARAEEVGMSGVRLARVGALVQGWVDAGKIPGAIAIVVRGGRTVHYSLHGQMDREAGKPMRRDTIFRIYSMTKPIASVALMTLYEEGAFQLDDPVSRFLPAFARQRVFDGGSVDDVRTREPKRPMTVRDVLMHTSGLIGAGGDSVVGQLYQRADLAGSRSGGTLSQMAEKLSALPLAFDPGSRWQYGISTDIVGHLCEAISGQPLDVFLRERIFAPLGMRDTGFQVPAHDVDRFAACYRRVPGQVAYALSDAPAGSAYVRPRTYFSGAGGLVSTADDYLRFCRMLLGGGQYAGASVLGSRTLAYMTRNHLPGNCDLAAMGQPRFTETTMEGIGFGLGFAVLLDPTVAQVIGTEGEYYWGGAASTAFFVSPREDLAMVLLTQLLPSGTYAFRREIRAAIYQAIVD